ncbi:MAG: hypothetical protein ACQETO_12395 [Pseudomonadota bacterium]
MSDLNLDDLRRAMLRGGIAPRYVRRTVNELQQHFQDLVDKALADGASPLEAEHRARTALGDERTLLDNVMNRDELKSWSAKYPRSVPLLAPLAALILFLGLSIAGSLALANAGLLAVPPEGSGTGWLRPIIQGLFGFNDDLLTPALAIFCWLTAQSRLADMTWPVIGIVLLTFIGSGWELAVHMPTALSDTGTMELTWGYAFLGIPVPEGHTTAAVGRFASTLALAATISVLYRAAGSRRATL